MKPHVCSRLSILGVLEPMKNVEIFSGSIIPSSFYILPLRVTGFVMFPSRSGLVCRHGFCFSHFFPVEKREKPLRRCLRNVLMRIQRNRRLKATIRWLEVDCKRRHQATSQTRREHQFPGVTSTEQRPISRYSLSAR